MSDAGGRGAQASALAASSKVFIGGLSWETTGERLRSYFENYGVVREAFVSYNRNNGRPRGFGFVVFESPEVADKVVATKHTIDRREVEAKKAVPKDEFGEGPGSGGQGQGSGASSSEPASRSRKVFVGGLAPSVDDAVLRAYFSDFGEVEDAVVMYDHDNKRPRGFGFVTFTGEDAVEAVFARGTMQTIADKQIEIKSAVPRDQMPATAHRPMLHAHGGYAGGRGPGGYGGMQQQHGGMYGGYGGMHSQLQGMPRGGGYGGRVPTSAYMGHGSMGMGGPQQQGGGGMGRGGMQGGYGGMQGGGRGGGMGGPGGGGSMGGYGGGHAGYAGPYDAYGMGGPGGAGTAAGAPTFSNGLFVGGGGAGDPRSGGASQLAAYTTLASLQQSVHAQSLNSLGGGGGGAGSAGKLGTSGELNLKALALASGFGAFPGGAHDASGAGSGYGPHAVGGGQVDDDFDVAAAAAAAANLAGGGHGLGGEFNYNDGQFSSGAPAPGWSN
ncbi:hypothetical protein FOA52_011130 [Chlamydomonas sp. UWO 241]|nr:hypothetical protein FOA52_011130 [Chlamydomonas sp. UWO 241]